MNDNPMSVKRENLKYFHIILNSIRMFFCEMLWRYTQLIDFTLKCVTTYSYDDNYKSILVKINEFLPQYFVRVRFSQSIL